MNQRSKVINVVLLAACCVLLLADTSLAVSPEELQKIESAAPAKATVNPNRPRKLLVFNLCNGFKHSSIPYWDKALQIMGQKTGAYEVVFSNRMEMFAPEMLNQYDAVCLNNTTKLDFSDSRLREGLMNFVKGGKGIVGIHAATDNFYDWPEAAEMMGAQFSGHPWRANGVWAIKIDDPDHPLTAAFGGKGFKINDELYRTKPPLYSRSKQRVLLSLDMTDDATRNVKGLEPTDNDTGISWIKSYGKGRVFYSSLGHNHDVVWTPAVLRHYLDGIQFALGDLPADTTPRSQRQLGKLLAEIAKYEYGQSRQPLAEIDDLICSASDSPAKLKQIEKRFLEFLHSDATPPGKQFICRKLSVIGSDQSVPTLAAMLTEKATSPIEPADMARYALERIPGSAADKALRDALDKTSGKVKVGIINSLGERGDKEAADQLSSLLSDSDEQIAEAALSALGKIGGRKAARVLLGAKSQLKPELQLALADACLTCADKFLAERDTRSAVRIYRQLYGAGGPSAIRAAALRGMVAAMPQRAGRVVIGALKGDNDEIRAVAIGLLREIQGKEVMEAAIAELPNLPVKGQVQLLSALADRGERSALDAAVNAAKSSDTDVRIAAFGALAVLGDASNVDLLVQAAANAEGAEQQAARGALYRLRGSGVDSKILANIPQAAPEVKIELIRSIGERNVIAGIDTLLKTAQAPQEEVRIESLKVLRVVADEKHLPALVDLLVKAQSEAERSEAENTVVAVARKIEDKDRQADKIVAASASVEQVQARCSLLNVLGKIGGRGALLALSKALRDSDAEVRISAVRALSDWPGAEPIEDLRGLAKSSGDERERVLTLRGFIRLIGLDVERPAEDRVRMYKEAMSLSANVTEKKSVLSGLANVKSLAALETAGDYLQDAALQQEAGAAVVRIAESTRAGHPQQTKAVLQKLIEISANDSLRQQAQKLMDQINQ
ncbi:MAG TPA: ThuA domain-containing protein [Sedimentisphaerales bacterium]|nr:ThuA domain-containing protein [Sedimentisphaerales bacterium]